MENITMEKIAYLTKMIRLLILEVIDLIIFFFLRSKWRKSHNDLNDVILYY